MTEAIVSTWGRNPLAGYLLLVLAASIVGGTLGLRFSWIDAARPTRAGPPPISVVAIATALLAAGLFVLIARQLGPGASLPLADQALTDAIHSNTPQAAFVWFARLTHLADPAFLIALTAVVVFWLWQRGRRHLMWLWLGAAGGNALLNPTLKLVFARDRPVFEPLLTQAGGFSFPSGHSSGAMVVYGALFYVALCTLRRPGRVAAGLLLPALIVAVAGSRVFLGVHFASDVWAGLLSGTAWLALCIGVAEWMRMRHAASVAPAT